MRARLPIPTATHLPLSWPAIAKYPRPIHTEQTPSELKNVEMPKSSLHLTLTLQTLFYSSTMHTLRVAATVEIASLTDAILRIILPQCMDARERAHTNTQRSDHRPAHSLIYRKLLSFFHCFSEWCVVCVCLCQHQAPIGFCRDLRENSCTCARAFQIIFSGVKREHVTHIRESAHKSFDRMVNLHVNKKIRIGNTRVKERWWLRA